MGLLAVVLLSAVVGAALGGGGDATLGSVTKWLLTVEVVLLLTAMWPLKVLVAEVGFLVLGG